MNVGDCAEGKGSCAPVNSSQPWNGMYEGPLCFMMAERSSFRCHSSSVIMILGISEEGDCGMTFSVGYVPGNDRLGPSSC